MFIVYYNCLRQSRSYEPRDCGNDSWSDVEDERLPLSNMK